ncbi:MAG TPA: hypothetical protein VLU46_14585 [Thermoanaerobaculia bacterium]|nr:hypothetical protein [Thermoanaerobaculia bacterium]
MTIIAALALVAMFGCKNQNQPQAASTSNTTSTVASSPASNATLSPEELGELGAKIRAHPSDAQKILSDRGLSTQSFEQQVRKVAEDPSASKRYADAYKKAKA